MRQLRIRLSSWESRRLRQLRDHADSARVVKRAMCVLRSARGDSAQTIARVTGLGRQSITRIRQRWQRRGLRSIRDRPRSGRPPTVTPEYRRELRRALNRSPRAMGYVFTVWSVARLGTYLQRRTGIRVSPDWLRRLVCAEGFSIGRPKHTLRNKRKRREYDRARRRLDQLKRGP